MRAEDTDFDLEPYDEALRIAIESDGVESNLVESVRAAVGIEISGLVLEAARLQSKARQKLGPGLWWCTERSLAQATAGPVARLKSRWVHDGRIYDLCCGLGSDSVALSRGRPNARLTAVDRDPVMAAMARANLRLNAGTSRCEFDVRCGDVGELQLPDEAFMHIDPDRRDGGSRKTRVDEYSPAWDTIRALIDQTSSCLVKVAPAARIDPAEPLHRLWISYAGSVREQSLLTGDVLKGAANDLGLPLSHSNRAAVVIASDESATAFCGTQDDHSCPSVEQPLAYIVDTDPAIRAAGLTAAYAAEKGLCSLGNATGFLTANDNVVDPLATSEPVVWAGACDDRKLRKTLRSLNAYPWRVKTRGVSQDANQLEVRYRNCGEKPVTLWIGRARKRQYAVISQQQ